MSLRAKRRRIAAVVLLVGAYLTAGIAIARVACVSSATLESRHGLRAALLMHPNLRTFPVEQYATADEAFEYTMSTVGDDQTRWRLRIDTSGQRTAFWRRVLAEHLQDRGFKNMRAPWRAGGRLDVFSPSRNRLARLFVKSDHVTFEYWPNLGRGRPKQPIALMRYYAFKIRRALRGKTPAIYTLTCPS